MNPDGRSIQDFLALQDAYRMQRARKQAADFCRDARWSPHICDEIEKGKHDSYVIVQACYIIDKQQGQIEELEDQIDGWAMEALERDLLS